MTCQALFLSGRRSTDVRFPGRRSATTSATRPARSRSWPCRRWADARYAANELEAQERVDLAVRQRLHAVVVDALDFRGAVGLVSILVLTTITREAIEPQPSAPSARRRRPPRWRRGFSLVVSRLASVRLAAPTAIFWPAGSADEPELVRELPRAAEMMMSSMRRFQRRIGRGVASPATNRPATAPCRACRSVRPTRKSCRSSQRASAALPRSGVPRGAG